ncbi:POK18 protein, partial [Mohoua ochrocephala]|nr:POK18 protein [Mohoua ochrocephala]
VKLAASVETFQLLKNEPLNLISDSLYVISILNRIEHSFLKEVHNKNLFILLSTLYDYVLCRCHCFYVIHFKSHTSLPRPLVESNAVMDALTKMATIPNQITQAKLSHEFYHQNANKQQLNKQFSLTLSQVRQIVPSCPDCAYLTPLPTTVGTNP